MSASMDPAKREIEIEHDIPIPPAHGGWGPRKPHTITATNLKPSESIFVETQTEMQTARRTVQRLGGKTQVRRAVNDEGIEGWRLWRTA